MKATLILFVVALVGAAPISVHADTLVVPDSYDYPSEAMAQASSGDTILVKDPEYPDTLYVDVFTIKSGVEVSAYPGHTPIIDGGTLAAITVDFESGSTSSTILEGFTIRGGTQKVVRVRGSGVVRDCVIENEGASGLTNGIRSDGNTTIEDCTIEMTGSQTNYGIYHEGGEPTITDCTVDVSEGTGIYITCPSATTEGDITGCSVNLDTGTAFYLRKGMFTVSDATVSFDTSDSDNYGFECGYTVGQARCTVKDCLVSVPDGVGIYIYDDSVKVHNITLDDVGSGIGCHPDAEVTVENCIVSNYKSQAYAFYRVTADYCIEDESGYGYDTGAKARGA